VRQGIPTISVGLPRRYSYSPNEMVDLNDATAAVRLLLRFVADMEGHGDLGFGASAESGARGPQGSSGPSVISLACSARARPCWITASS
jgi:hypothetical protein